MIMGIDPAIVRLPLLTIPTIKEVVVDELWNKTVAKMPIKRAMKGSLVVVRTVSANPEPMCFMAEDIPAIPTRNIYRAEIIPVDLTAIFNVSLFTNFFWTVY
jgi:hypothetical protein